MFFRGLMLCVMLVIASYIMAYIFAPERPYDDNDFFKKLEDDDLERKKNNNT